MIYKSFLLAAALFSFPSFVPADVFEFTGKPVDIKANAATFKKETVDGKQVLKASYDFSEKFAFVRIEPKSGTWNLSKYSGVEVTIKNAGTEAVRPGVRIDEAVKAKKAKEVEEPLWNTARLRTIQPGQTETIRIIFGMDYNEPRKIDISKLGGLVIFAGKDRLLPSELVISEIKAVE